MENFEFHNPTHIIFGKGAETKAGEMIRRYGGGKVLLHYGGGFIKKYGLYDVIVKSLGDAQIEYAALGGVVPNPRLSLVREGIELCRGRGIDYILAVGGGSVIDSAKAIAMGMPYGGDVWDFYAGKAEAETVLPVGVVLTIPAAGSETSTGSVITNEDGWYKRAYNSPLLRPRFAILDPALAYTLPAYQTAAGAADIMAHVMERYFTNVTHVDLTDRLCEATLRTVIKHAPVALREPENYDARAEIMWAGTLAHNDLMSTGRIGDWASHAIEHELSGIYDVAHGAGLAVILPAWMRYVYKHNLRRFIQFAMRVFDLEYDFDDPARTALAGIDRLKEYFESTGLAVTLTDLGIGDDRLEEMAHKCAGHHAVGNLVNLGEKDVLEIFRLAM
jgi:alcohol dehydrogenase YqhD (iron-dependent ADH family)